MDPINLIAIVLIVALYAYLSNKNTQKRMPKANFRSFSEYVNYWLRKGKGVTPEDIEHAESFAIAMGIPFTAREEARYLAEETPKKVKKLREKAEKAKKLWNKLSNTSKYLAYVAAIVVFGILYNNWAGPLWDMLVTSTQFVWGVLKSVPQSVLAAVPFIIFLYVAKKLADYRKKLHKERAAAVESTLPEINKINAILNQQ